MRSVGDTNDADSVLAHVLLNTFSIIAGRASTMRVAWEDLDPAKREYWLADMERLAVELRPLLHGRDDNTRRLLHAELPRHIFGQRRNLGNAHFHKLH